MSLLGEEGDVSCITNITIIIVIFGIIMKTEDGFIIGKYTTTTRNASTKITVLTHPDQTIYIIGKIVTTEIAIIDHTQEKKRTNMIVLGKVVETRVMTEIL